MTCNDCEHVHAGTGVCGVKEWDSGDQVTCRCETKSNVTDKSPRPTTPEAIRRVLEALRRTASTYCGDIAAGEWTCDNDGAKDCEHNAARTALAAYAARLPLAEDEGMLREMREAAFANPEHAGPRDVLVLIDKKLGTP